MSLVVRRGLLHGWLTFFVPGVAGPEGCLDGHESACTSTPERARDFRGERPAPAEVADEDERSGWFHESGAILAYCVSRPNLQ